jgi:general nucleoside transport system ATP-binding protein
MPHSLHNASVASAKTSITPHIALRGIGVRFGGVIALDNVDIDLRPGERHAVVGENGAGKSTLMRALFGLLTPDAGTILVDGTAQCFRSPADAIALGIGMVQQHFELIPSFTVAENILLGAERTRGFGIRDVRQGNDAISRMAAGSGLPIDPAERVGELSVAAQQRVEILKALYRNARVLILDEPTAVLAPAEARDLWASVRRLSEEGATVVFITHKLDEVMANADAVTVLRRGKRVFSVPVAETSSAALATAMVGDGVVPAPTSLTADRNEEAPETDPEKRNTNPTLSLKNITVNGLRGERAVDRVSLEIVPGEILGLAGVDGSGQMELIEAILGLRKVECGQILFDGREVTSGTIARRRAAGMGYIPDDRHYRAVSLPLSCEENAILGRQREPEFCAAGWLKASALRGFLETASAGFDIRGAGWRVPLRALSGGNQQKLVLARELSRQPRLLLAAQPTRGLDFAATAFIRQALRKERDRGTAILLQSLDLTEVLSLSDRVAVMLRGRIVAVLDRAEATEERVGALMTAAGGPGA